MLNPTTLWEDFQNKMVGPLIKQLGARTYNLVRGTQSLLEEARPFDEFLTGIVEQEHSAVKTAVEQFFDPSDADVRTWLLSRLHAYFLGLAAQIDHDTLRALSEARGAKLQFVVVLDTNFLFSLLDVHRNPSNEAAKLLVELIKEISELVDVTLCVLPLTVSEALDALRHAKKQVPQEVVSPHMAEATLSQVPLGLVSRYLERIVEAGEPIRRDDYFDLYINDFDYVLDEHAVQVIDDPLAEQLRQNGQLSGEANRLRTETRKGLNTIWHDLVLWRYVDEKRRPERTHRPSETKYWGVTVDYAWLLRYDRERRQALQGLPRVMHPTQFIHMLQFWVPRSERMEKALFGSARLPLLFPEFDEQTEKVTLRILNGIARFKNAPDLSTGTVLRILQDRALRAKIFRGVSQETVDAEVESSAFRLADEREADQERAERELRKLREENLRLKEERATRDVRTQGSNQSKKKLQTEMQRQEEQNRKQQGKLQEQNKNLLTKLTQLDEKLTEVQQTRERERALWRFGLVWGLLSLTVVVGGLAAWFYWLDSLSGKPWRLGVLVLSCVCLVLAFGDGAYRRLARGHPMRFFGHLATVNKYVWGLYLGGIVGAAVQFAVVPPG